MVPKRTVVLDGQKRKEPTLAYLDNDHYKRTKDGVTEHNVPKWNWEGVREPSKLQKKRLISLVMMKVMETALTNHLYQFNEQIYRQSNGGPIGDNITNLDSQLVMYTFATRYKAKLLNLGLYEYVVLFKIYVDDHNQAGWCLPYGTLYTAGKLYIPGKGWRG